MAGYYRGRSNFQNAGKPKRQWNPNWKKGPTVEPGSLWKPPAQFDEYQSAIIQHMDDPQSLIVDSKAGVGKTTVCCASMYHILEKHPNAKVGYLIYASRNKTEAVGKCPPKSVVSTVHAAGLKRLGSVYGKLEVSKDKNALIAETLIGMDEEKDEARYFLAKTIDLCNDYLIDDEKDVSFVMGKHGLDTCGYSEEFFSEKVMEGIKLGLKMIKDNKTVSFSEMVSAPLRFNLPLDPFDYLFTDECQDLNRSRTQFVLRSVGEKTKLVAVGDLNQQLFAFTGAEKDTIDKLRLATSAMTLPLNRTYRCGKAIVQLARTIVPEYEAAEGNEEGEVNTEVPESKMLEEAGPGDFILSRINAPLIGLAMNFLKQGRKCNIQGRDIGAGLLFMVKRSKAGDVDSFLSWLADWQQMEQERAVKSKRPVEQIADKADCLRAFCEGTRDIVEVRRRIKDMFDDKEEETDRIICSTIHRAKGLERDRVWLLESSFVIRPKNEDDERTERCCRYVAITRAKSVLNLVS